MIGEDAIKEEMSSDGEDAKHDDNEQDSEGYFSMPSSQSHDSYSFDIKSPSAKDFFDIDEVAEDDVRLTKIMLNSV